MPKVSTHSSTFLHPHQTPHLQALPPLPTHSINAPTNTQSPPCKVLCRTLNSSGSNDKKVIFPFRPFKHNFPSFRPECASISYSGDLMTVEKLDVDFTISRL